MADEPYKPQDRRPIAARNRAAAQRIAQWLADRNVSPNLISILGMLAGIAAGAALAATSFTSSLDRVAWIVGAALVQLRLLANMFDGMVAIEQNRQSALGELYNEIPDRVSDAFILIGLGYATGGDIMLGYVAACLAIFVAYVRAMGGVAGAGQVFCGPMAKPHRMFVVTVIALYCALAPLRWQPTLADGPGWGVSAAGLAVIILGCVFTLVRRLRHIGRSLAESSP
ncbi:MAG: CDP-alcohol phosphatidyltransferase family protein [Phycisphaerales bacterium]